jgi:DNA mismatch repair protein MLH1
VENIKMLYGSNVADELLPFSWMLEEDVFEQALSQDLASAISARGYFSSSNYHQRSLTFILFTNGRLVRNDFLRKALENVYSKYLPKQCHPFIYLDLKLPPQILDVNVHPTKHEVRFLHEVLVNKRFN